jgi:hypothetical protein
VGAIRWVIDRSRPKDRPGTPKGSQVALNRVTLPDGRKVWGSAYVMLAPPSATAISPKLVGEAGETTPWLGFPGPRTPARRYDQILDKLD